VTDFEKYSLVCDAMEQRYPVIAPVWRAAFDRFGDAWLHEFVRNVEVIYGTVGATTAARLVEALDAYAEFANDSMRNQVFFEKHGRYRASSYADVRRDCYLNEDHMTRCYLPGMYLSHFLWPQHFHMLTGFRSTILPRVREAKLFYEVGVGCGIYSKVTLEAIPNATGVGLDISPYALEFTHEMLQAFGLGDRYKVLNQDIRDGAPPCDFLICQEVLEHLENPAEFCVWLSNLVRPGGHAYITAALNAAHSDHIYLFREPRELEDMVRAAGFQPLHGQEEFAPGRKPRATTPSLAGFMCERV
jgi:2-polyprenyl-3-methyl-5-hydroxy-6-metoxy-1,4-benzoquinol methylase